MFTPRLTFTFADGADVLQRSFTKSGGELRKVSESIPNGSNQALVAQAFDVSQIKALFITSDKDILIETNNSGSPVNVFTLAAGQPFVWAHGYQALIDTGGTEVETDITALYVTNAGADPAQLEIRALIDPTL